MGVGQRWVSQREHKPRDKEVQLEPEEKDSFEVLCRAKVRVVLKIQKNGLQSRTRARLVGRWERAEFTCPLMTLGGFLSMLRPIGPVDFLARAAGTSVK